MSFCCTVILILIYFSAVGHRPKTNYYQYSLGILALCVSGVRVSTHVSQKLIHAVEHRQIKHGESLCVGEFKATLFLFLWFKQMIHCRSKPT